MSDDGFEGLRVVEDADGLAVTCYSDRLDEAPALEQGQPEPQTWRDREPLL